MTILAIDCSAVAASCAVLKDDLLIAEAFTNVKLTHSETLMPMVENMLSSARLSLSDIDAFAISNGPGSFTGIRIGISAVKGMAMPKNAACIAVSTLESMAYNLLGNDCYVCALMDARCNQFYNALFRIKGNEINRLCEDQALLFDEITDLINNLNSKAPVICVGDGAALFCKKAEGMKLNIKEAPETLIYQRASSVAMLASKKSEEGEMISSQELLPFYLRLPQAERELKKRKEDNKC